MGECFRGGDRNVRQFYSMPIKTARDIPTANRVDSNGYLDERIAVQLCLKVFPAGTLVSSRHASCQWMRSVYLWLQDTDDASCTRTGMFVCIVMYICLVFYIFSGLLGSGWFGCLFVLMYCKECGMF